MYRVGIWERDGIVAAAVRAGLSTGGVAAELIVANHPAAWAEAEPELLVVAPSATGWAGAGAIRCGTVLLPGGMGALARSFQGVVAVSYGVSAKDTVTLSSLEGARIAVAVQRELVTLDGQMVERQELLLPCAPELAPQLCLAAVGALLLLGVPPEALTQEKPKRR